MHLSQSDFEIFQRENLECFQMASEALAHSREPYPVGVLYREHQTQTVKMIVVNLEAQVGAVRVFIGPEDRPIDESTFSLSENKTVDAKTLMDRTIRLILWNRDKIA